MLQQHHQRVWQIRIWMYTIFIDIGKICRRTGLGEQTSHCTCFCKFFCKLIETWIIPLKICSDTCTLLCLFCVGATSSDSAQCQVSLGYANLLDLSLWKDTSSPVSSFLFCHCECCIDLNVFFLSLLLATSCPQPQVLKCEVLTPAALREAVGKQSLHVA